MAKLDHDFTEVNLSMKILVPSEYVKQYPHADIKGIDIYKRWSGFDEAVYTLDDWDLNYMRMLDAAPKNLDILMYKIDSGHRYPHPTKQILFRNIIFKGSVDTILGC